MRPPALLLTVPASSERLRVLRTTIATVAASTGMTLDQVDDVRLAVEEAAAVLLGGFPTMIMCQVDEMSSPLVVQLNARTTEKVNTAEDSFAWTILDALTADARIASVKDASVKDGGNGTKTQMTTITLRFDPAPHKSSTGPRA